VSDSQRFTVRGKSQSRPLTPLLLLLLPLLLLLFPRSSSSQCTVSLMVALSLPS